MSLVLQERSKWPTVANRLASGFKKQAFVWLSTDVLYNRTNPNGAVALIAEWEGLAIIHAYQFRIMAEWLAAHRDTYISPEDGPDFATLVWNTMITARTPAVEAAHKQFITKTTSQAAFSFAHLLLDAIISTPHLYPFCGDWFNVLHNSVATLLPEMFHNDDGRHLFAQSLLAFKAPNLSNRTSQVISEAFHDLDAVIDLERRLPLESRPEACDDTRPVT